MSDEDIEKSKSYNLKLYPFYKMVSWDLLFYYAISFMFLTSVKNLDASQILLIDSIYTLFKFVLQIPLVIITDKLGKRKSLIYASLFLSLFVILIMAAANFYMVIIANLFAAISFSMKGLCESSFLYDCAPHGDDRNKIFSKIDGGANSRYYYLDAFSCVTTGLLAAVSPYLSLCVTLFFCLLSVYLATKFKEIRTLDNSTNKAFSIKNHVKNLKYSFRFILKSNRLKGLILFGGIFYAFLALLATLRRSLFNDIQIPVAYIGILFALFGIFSGVASSAQNTFHKRFKNKLLKNLTIITVITCVASGLAVLLELPSYILLPVVFLSFSVQFVIKGVYFTINKKYLNSFSTSDLRTKIFSVNNLFEALCASLTSFLCSLLLKVTTTSVAFIVFGLLFFAILLIILKYMKTRVGLKPEQYRKEDIPVPVR